MTQELQALSPTALERGDLPANTSLAKLFWSADVENVTGEFETVRKLGSAATEEWLKGLDGRRRERQNDSSRWENWAASGGITQVQTLLYPGYQPRPLDSLRPSVPISNIGTSLNDHRPTYKIPGLAQPSSTPQGLLYCTFHQESNSHYLGQENPQPTEISDTSGDASYQQRPVSQARHERTREEVAELKAARRAEIERRALQLDPPLPANVLAHIPSFQAAIQIITPLDDKAWDLLKPRLIAQRDDAEQREKEIVAQSRIKEQLDEKRTLEVTKDVREVMDADWDEIQAPVRARIAGYADEIIRNSWDDGDKVSKDNSPKFAVEVLGYIRKRFYAEVAKDAAAARAAGEEPIIDPPQGPFTQKLTLENMKWIFDTKIKPHTETFRKELFLCNGCEGNFRYYGFEGVIQHYAAKHTSALSSGNIVVHWRAEWPEIPPFTWEARHAKSTYYNQGAAPLYSQGATGPPPQYGYNAYQQAPPSMPPQTYPPYPNGPAPPYSAPPFGEQYTPPAHAPYSSQGGYAPQPHGYGPGMYHQPDPYQQYHSTPAPGSAYPRTQAPPHNYPPSGPGPLPQSTPAPATAPAPVPGQYNYNYGAYQNNHQLGYSVSHTKPYSEQYRVQLDDVARNARELWTSTSNMKDVPGSIRVQVVLHHLAKRFLSKFTEPLQLAMFNDGLSNNKDMRPVRNINGLMCKVCQHGIGGYVANEQDRKAFSLPQLTNHFQTKHIEPFANMEHYATPPDWTADMVLLPDSAVLSKLRMAVGNDSHKYYLVSDALPQAFEPVDLSHLPHAEPTWPQNLSYPDEAQSPSEDNYTKYYVQPHAAVQQPEPAQAPTQEVGYYGQHTGQPQSLGSGLAVNPGYQQEPSPYQPELPPSSAVYGQQVMSAQASNAHLGKSDDRKSTQGYGSGRDQAPPRRSKKQKKRGGRAVNEDEEAASKLNEEEAKMAEEEERRREEEIRAMWAAERAETARKTAHAEDEKPSQASGKRPKSTGSSRQPSKPQTPQRQQRQAAVQRRESPAPVRDEPNLMSALEMHLNNPPSPVYVDREYREPPRNVIYMDGTQPAMPQRDARRSPEVYPRYESARVDVPPRRSRSPPYADYGRPPPAQQYRERSPPPRQPEPIYQSRPAPLPMEDVRYERAPRDDFYSRPYRDEPPPRPRATEYVEYEIVEVRDSQGTYFLERPIRRQPAEPERYYQQPPVVYEAERPVRREVEPYPPYDAPYSRAAAPPHPGYERFPPASGAAETPAPTPQPRYEPAYEDEYDPRFPAAPPSAAPPRQVRYQ